MTAKHKGSESSVTDEIIKRIHLTLADEKTGAEIIDFLKVTEPAFMNEVNRFIQTEMSRMRYQITDTQAMYIGSVIGASYIAGFLIAREAGHQVFDGQFTFKSDIKEALTTEDFDRICDEKRKEGRSYKDVAKAVRKMIFEKTNPVVVAPKKKKAVPVPKSAGARLDIGDLE